MRKRWRYVGVYGPEVMLCAGRAWIGPAPQAWWAVWDRRGRRLHERTRLLTGRDRVALADTRVTVRDGDVEIDLTLEREPSSPVEVVTPDGERGGYAWTRKEVPRVHGSVRAGGRRWDVDGRALVDDSDGYHARRTAWRWSAGTGSLADGRALAWNLVEGIHDSAHDSERTLWIDGTPRESEPGRFADDLRSIDFADGSRLSFAPEATRRRDDSLLLVRSRYEQPFGTFSGALPGGLEVREGFGVMERHEALW
jgi:hypothetical protein